VNDLHASLLRSGVNHESVFCAQALAFLQSRGSTHAFAIGQPLLFRHEFIAIDAVLVTQLVLVR